MIRELEKKNCLFTFIGAFETATNEAAGISILNSITIDNNALSVVFEMKKEKNRRSRFNQYSKAGLMDKLNGKYFDENQTDPV